MEHTEFMNLQAGDEVYYEGYPAIVENVFDGIEGSRKVRRVRLTVEGRCGTKTCNPMVYADGAENGHNRYVLSRLSKEWLE